MLQVDLTRIDLELRQIVTNSCAAFGIVRSVRIHRHPKAFALVEMSTQHATLELASQYGGSAFGSCALVYLEQAEQPQRSAIG